MFSQKAQEELGYYVYCLVDPRDKKIFYIGKGVGNRVFAHACDALEYEDVNTDKLEKIREIIKSGHEVEHYIIRHKLTEEDALTVESVLIDFLTYQEFNTESLLTNIVAGHHQWDEGREIEAGNGGYVMKYICELCGKFKEETITIIPPQDCPFEYSITVEGHSKIMLCDCCDAPAIVKPHNDLDKNQTCDECGYVFDTTGINGKYTPELLANLNHNINKIDSLIIEEEILYVILQNNESEKIGKFELNSESSIKLNQIINIDDLSFTNEESKNIVNQLLDKDSFYSMEIASIPEIAPTYILVELNNEFYYIYMESNIAGVSLVTIYHLNK